MRRIFVLLTILILLFLSACAKEDKRNYNMFSTVIEQSEINWYLKKTYGEDAPKKCNYYEFECDKGFCVLVELPKRRSTLSSKNDVLPEYVLFIYGLESELTYLQDPCCFSMASVEALPNKTEQDTYTYKLTPDIDEEYNTDISAIYIMYVKSTAMERLLVETSGSYSMFCYQYNPDGLVSTMYFLEGDQAYDAFLADVVSYDEMSEVDFQYNEDGSLAGITDEGGSTRFTYKNGMRSYVVSQSLEGTPEETRKISYVRNSDGLVEEMTMITYGEKLSCKIDYYDDGTAKASYSSDNNDLPYDETEP